ncbi:MAG: hypothetical protein A2365_01355 [Candidatus Nealsonbacteria bacterium RIFOXYB1_FULL_40_15]|uniref:Peptidase S11 D-alanyl-D-alanine carboxypeptidase A N-terminal domain-containing protein n=2 Tax=Candidatus Nealsoniibacteriota TaxID=1817911 RepID=A0A1G2EPY7_9BACT|nr:MAG: hypothetical protein A2365_01355 [Candidatus Nealsonbacteria bacterium RIFOXYB1_FULL_40_15]OGZ27864.1 MAG: hypothetical protein A2427_04085 [Candidatus Nealsonbacteria bacterium RIFOXYC1_FULL_40_7]OGZ28023.1 MAG: hypothetical protein A2562_01435 [Candidatus Nealsonbacteria bacterium RIFOXYD1_FULL_39_11]
MSKNSKYLIGSLVFFLPFWWSINIFAGKLDSFQILKTEGSLSARMDETLINIKDFREDEAVRKKLESLQIDAPSALVASRNKILLQKNSGEMMPIASLTKLMTALVAYESYNLEEETIISKEALAQDGDSGLNEGDSVSLKYLLNRMLIESSNDSAFALAEAKGERAFVDLMNIYAVDLGLSRTYFVNSTGLDPRYTSLQKNFSTAEDLSVLSEHILKTYPGIFDITKEQDKNTNQLLLEYPGIIGGKTGWTPLAKGCLLVVFQKDGKEYVCIVLGAEDRFGEMRKILDVLK